MNYKDINLFLFSRYHSAAAMRSAYNTGGVSSTGGVSDCAGLQSIGAAITSAATGTEKKEDILVCELKKLSNL